MSESGEDGSPLHPLWRFLSGLTTPSPFIADHGIREQSALLARLLLFMLVWALAMALLIRLVLIPAAGWSNPQLVLAALFLCVLLLAHHANRRGHYLIAAVLTVGGLLAGIFAGAHLSLFGLMEPSYARDDVNILAYLLVPVILGALLLPMKWLTATLVVATAGVLFVPVVHPQVELSALLYGPLLYVVAVGVLLLFFAYVGSEARRRSYRMMEWREERYRSLFEQSPDAMFLVSMDGVTEAINSAGLALFGYEREAIEGDHIQQLYASPEERAALVAKAERQGTLVDESLRMRRRDGSVIDCLVSIRLRTGPSGVVTGYQTVVRDVTARMKTGEDVRLKGQLLDLVQDVVLLVEPGGEIVYSNEAGVRLTGYTLNELVGMNIRQLNTPEGAERVPALISAMMREGQYEFGTVWVGRRGNRIDVEVRSSTVESRGRPLFLSVARDVTGRKADEAELRLRSELLDHASDAILLHDLNGKLLYVNEAAAYQAGYARSELVGMSLRDLDDPETSARMRNRMAELVNKREISFEGGHRRKDGSVFPVEVRARLVDWEDRGVVLSVARDITARKKAEAETLRSREELTRSAELLRDLATYLEEAREKERTGIARELHDQLGQALTALKMDLDGVRRMTDSGADVPVERLDRMAALLDETVIDVRRISSDLRPGILDDAGLVAAIEWQLDRFRERSDIECILEARGDDASLGRAQSTALFRVFQELLTNVARHAGATQVWVNVECDTNECSLSVSDDGRGITEEQASSTVSLGIVGIRERLRPLHGSIRFLKRRPKGTTVRVTVPVK